MGPIIPAFSDPIGCFALMGVESYPEPLHHHTLLIAISLL